MGAPSTKRFTIRRRLGEGGMGVVYEAFDEERRAKVALKTLNRFDGDALARFKREFRALQGLAHPNLVALDELFFENDQWFFTMELLAGVDFVSYVRGAPPTVAFQSTIRESVGKLAARAPVDGEGEASGAFDEGKLRDGLRQLLEGLSALHAVERVHRDIKPSNVMVTSEGRVVLLDFGLVTEGSADARSTGSAVVGTPAYMAPEQAASREVGPAADLYAVGVMLYETLTGRLPIEGPQLQVLVEKQTREPVRPARIAPEVPEDLDGLCAKLLRLDPAQRPSALDAIQALAATPPRASGVDLRRSASAAATFVGRAAELAELREAYDLCRQGRPTTVLVCGESGIGKSRLLRQFTAQIFAEHPETMLFAGRCYERETIPYKTLDGVVDALANRLSRVPPDELKALLPARCAVLAQVFPALLRVAPIAKAHAASALVIDPHEHRRRAFSALRELLTRAALRRPTVLVIDDLQWADDDGLRALGDILCSPDAPPLLLLGTARAMLGKDDPGIARLRATMPGETRVIEVASLGHDDARELAAVLLRHADNREADPDRIATEAGGHPLFLEELARHVAFGEAEPGDAKLDAAIWSRIAQLEPKAREVAELVAIAGKPIPQEVVAAAAHIEPGELTRRAAALRAANVVRTSGARWADSIEPYHDRVREAVTARLEAPRRRALHEALAIAFEASSRHDVETLAVHWREANNAPRASQYAAIAADQAAEAFAFDRATQWYEEALRLSPKGDPSRRALHEKLGHALGNAGRGALAAPHFETAALEATPREALQLRRRAAEQTLRSGEIDRGMRLMRDVLAMVAIRLPATRLEMLFAIVWFRFVLALRGGRFRERQARLVAPAALMRVDACVVVATSCGFVDPLLGALFAARALLLALRAGEVQRIACASAIVATAYAATGTDAGWRRAEALLETSRSLAGRCESPVPRIWALGCRGNSLYCQGRFREALETLEQSHEFVRTRAPEMVFEVSVARIIHLGALWFTGRFKSFWENQQGALRDATARGDMFSTVTTRIGLPACAWLTRDRADLAENNTRTALAEWPNGGFQGVHVLAQSGRTLVSLYAGDAELAHRTARDLVTKVRSSLSWRVAIDRGGAIYLRALSAVALSARDTAGADGLLELARDDASRLENEVGVWTRPFAASLRAGVALCVGAREEALSRLAAAERDFAAQDLLGYAAAARYHAASLRGDAAEKARAADYFRSEDVVAPAKMIRTLIAGFPE